MTTVDSVTQVNLNSNRLKPMVLQYRPVSEQDLCKLILSSQINVDAHDVEVSGGHHEEYTRQPSLERSYRHHHTKLKRSHKKKDRKLVSMIPGHVYKIRLGG